MGIAPEANLISVKVSDEDGNADVLDVIYGLQFAVDHKTAHNIRVINLSLSSTVAESYLTDPLDAAVEQAWNCGHRGGGRRRQRGHRRRTPSTYAPANDPYVISVGSVNDRNTRTVLDDLLSPWSSRGTTQDGFRKPEVLAPGTSLTAAVAPEQRPLEDVPRLPLRGRPLLQDGRHLDGRRDRLGRRGADPRGASRAGRRTRSRAP